MASSLWVCGENGPATLSRVHAHIHLGAKNYETPWLQVMFSSQAVQTKACLGAKIQSVAPLCSAMWLPIHVGMAHVTAWVLEDQLGPAQL